MPGEEKRSDIKAPFNMAINTLERLGEILSKIRRLSEEPFLTKDIKQSIKTSLVIDFYVQAVPLLSEAMVEKHKAVLDLKPKALQIIRATGEVTNRRKEVFDWELEKQLNQYLIDIQTELQNQNYFMPPKKDPGRAVGFY